MCGLFLFLVSSYDDSEVQFEILRLLPLEMECHALHLIILVVQFSILGLFICWKSNHH